MGRVQSQDPFSRIFGSGRTSEARPAPPDRPAQWGDMAVACPNYDCDGIHYRHVGENPHVLCSCGQKFNSNHAKFLGRIDDSGELTEDIPED